MKFKFTDTLIEAAASARRPQRLSPLRRWKPRLAVCVAVDSKHFVFQIRPDGGSQYRKTLGKFPALNTAEARKAVKVLAGRVAKGDDLRAEKTARR